MHITSTPPPADPAPLGLAAFALTTFLLSAYNAQWTHGTTAWLGYALAYGGLTQLAAGMWEFRNRNHFGATAFSSFGGFWIGLGLYALLVLPKAKGTELNNDLGWIALVFAVFTGYMMLWSMFTNSALFGVFLTLEATYVILAIAFLNNSVNGVKAGGYVGMITAVVAWYASAAILINRMSPKKPVLPVGPALLKFPE